MPEFITFKKFDDAALAWALTDLFNKNGIEYLTEEGAFSFNPTFNPNKELAVEYIIKIHPADFTHATELLKAGEAEDIKLIHKHYYLYSFTNEELLEIMEKADEWSTFDHELARKLLAEREVDISDNTIASLDEKRVAELRKPDGSQITWIILGYLLAIWIILSYLIVTLFAVLGLFTGWHLAWHKKTLPTGEKVYGYKASDRLHGKIIFYLSAAATIIGVIRLLKIGFTTYNY